MTTVCLSFYFYYLYTIEWIQLWTFLKKMLPIIKLSALKRTINMEGFMWKSEGIHKFKVFVFVTYHRRSARSSSRRAVLSYSWNPLLCVRSFVFCFFLIVFKWNHCLDFVTTPQDIYALSCVLLFQLTSSIAFLCRVKKNRRRNKKN